MLPSVQKSLQLARGEQEQLLKDSRDSSRADGDGLSF